MRHIILNLSLVFAIVLLSALSSAADKMPQTRPIRVLFINEDTARTGNAVPLLMEKLGRDAIYFDSLKAAEAMNPEMLAHYDVVLLDSAQKLTDDQNKVLGGFAQGRAAVIRKNLEPEASKPDFAQTMRGEILAAAGEKTVKEWEAFVAQREPEKREPHPMVANYENRPKPITFQHPFDVKGSMERTQVPADMRLEYFAGHPDIAKPIAFAWDERGRLWIAETRDYPHGVVPGGEGNDDIKICEDTDGDGRADKFTVFADHLNLPTSITFSNGGIIVTQPPQLIFLKSSKGDDHADIRTVLMDAWRVHDTHAQASNLKYGLDNWIYGAVGYSGFSGMVGGKMHEFAMGSYRFRPDGSQIEFLHQFTNNTWAQSANDAGDQFGGTANGAPIFFGGIPATAFPEGAHGMTAKKINLVEKAHAITPNYRQVDVMGGYTAAAGSNFIYSANMPARMQGQAMVCEPTMKILSLMDVQPDGAGYKAGDGMNLLASTDEWMSPVHAEVGPDGAVWVADWQNFIIQHNPTPSVELGGFKGETGSGGAHKNDLRDHERGRIYRVVWEKATKPAITSLKGATHAQLVAALNNDTQFWRLKAQQMLIEGKAADVAPELKKMVAANDGSIGAIHALWTLDGLGLLDEATHKTALYAKDARLRRNAVRALGTDAKSPSLYFGSGVMTDPDPITRLAALVKLSDFPTTKEIVTLVRKLNTDKLVREDEWLLEAAKMLAKKHNAAAYKEGPNLLPNPGLETLAADKMPQGWARRDYNENATTKGAKWEIVSGNDNVHGGEHALRCIAKGKEAADTSFFADVPLKPNTEYKLSAWIKARAFRGEASMNDHINRPQTEIIGRDTKGWREVEVIYNSGKNPLASLNILFVGTGEVIYDDLKFCEIMPEEDASEKVMAGDPVKGKDIFWNHPVAACKNCHMLGGVGSTVGPPLDGIAGRKDEAYINQSLIEPNAVLAQGYEVLKISPMPPMGLILKPQELADVKAFILTLKEQPKK